MLYTGNASFNTDPKTFSNLKNVKLWDLHIGANEPWWKRLIQSAKSVEKVYLYNIPINDDDIVDIINFNPLTKVFHSIFL